MKRYTKVHTYVEPNVSPGYIGRDTRKELKPIQNSLRVWKIRGDADDARKIEQQLAWLLHNDLKLENHYLMVLKQHLDGCRPDRYRTTRSGELVWSGAKELHYLGSVRTDRLFPGYGPSAKFHDAVKAIETFLRGEGLLFE